MAQSKSLLKVWCKISCLGTIYIIFVILVNMRNVFQRSFNQPTPVHLLVQPLTDIQAINPYQLANPRLGRHLMAVANCAHRALDEFPPDFFTEEQRAQGGVVVHFLISFYLFAALAIVCDDYFVPAVETISERLRLKPDVAGATFMAAGSSAPELFTSMIGVFISQNDIGTGTIVGSAIFNVLCIISLVALFAGMVLKLSWYPLFRDSLYYMISVAALIIVIHDGVIFWYEALVMLVLYALYIVIMYFNESFETFVVSCFEKWRGYDVERSAEKDPLIGTVTPPYVTRVRGTSIRSSKSYSEQETSFGAVSPTPMDLDYEEVASIFEIPDNFFKRVYWLLMLPVAICLVLTCPDCRRPGIWKRLYIFTFLISIVWIAGMSYVLVWMVTVIGDTLKIPDTVMGLTLLAAGTSIPDALAGIFVARDGYGDMAISNSIGSNIFDILLCLGLPWFIRTAILVPGKAVEMISAGLVFATAILFGTVVFLVLSMVIYKWKMDKKYGAFVFVVYIIAVGISSWYELSVALPPCPVDPL